jgi:hypothetical protein
MAALQVRAMRSHRRAGCEHSSVMRGVSEHSGEANRTPRDLVHSKAPQA